MNIDVKKFLPYIATAMITAFICWLLWNSGRQKDHLENERKSLQAERELIDARKKKWHADSVALRDEMKRNDAYWKRRYNELDEDYERLQKNSKPNLSDFTDAQLDSIRKRLYAN